MENKAKWNVSTKIEKFETYRDFEEGNVSEIQMIDGNTLLNGGVADLWNLVCGNNNQGGGVNHFDNTHAYIGVGDSNTASDKAQTGLLATTNIFYKHVDANYPVVDVNKVSFKATFYGTGAPIPADEASFEWKEWSVARGFILADMTPDGAATILDDTTAIAANIHKNLNRKVEDMGTKAEAATWVITVEISLT